MKKSTGVTLHFLWFLGDFEKGFAKPNIHYIVYYVGHAAE